MHVLGDNDLESGNVVQLISGGLPMTVAYGVGVAAAEATGKEIGVHCDWLDNEGRPHHGVFTRQQLMRCVDIERAADLQKSEPK